MADVSALERALTPASLRSEFSHDVAAAPLVIADANLSPAALEVGRSNLPTQSAYCLRVILPTASVQASCRSPSSRQHCSRAAGGFGCRPVLLAALRNCSC